MEHVQKIFAEAGLAENVIQYFHCGSLTRLESIVRSPEIKLICFTGSVAGGLQVQRAASDRVVPVGLELGGKDPAYVREDVDVKWAAEEIVDGAVFNSGQSCCSIERVYVAEKIHDAFVSAVQDVLKGYKLGDPFEKSTNVGPVVSKKSADTVKAQVEDAIAKGAKDMTPQNETFTSPPPDGNYIRPTLLVDVNHGMVRLSRNDLSCYKERMGQYAIFSETKILLLHFQSHLITSVMRLFQLEENFHSLNASYLLGPHPTGKTTEEQKQRSSTTSSHMFEFYGKTATS